MFNDKYIEIFYMLVDIIAQTSSVTSQCGSFIIIETLIITGINIIITIILVNPSTTSYPMFNNVAV